MGGEADVLAALRAARDRGFLGPGPVVDHLAHAEAFLAAWAVAPARLLDLGTGGGVPGLVLADRWPGTEIVLLDAQARRTEFLAAAIADLGWAERVRVIGGRAEEIAREAQHRHRYDGVVARSFGPPAVTAECGAPFLTGGGVLVVAERPDASDDRWPAAGLAELGLRDGGVVRAGAGTVRRLEAVRCCEARYPRRVGVPRKRPLF